MRIAARDLIPRMHLYVALEVINLGLYKDVEDNNRALPDCTSSLNRQYGLPCAYQIATLVRANAQINLKHLDKHWWLKRGTGKFGLLGYLYKKLTV